MIIISNTNAIIIFISQRCDFLKLNYSFVFRSFVSIIITTHNTYFQHVFKLLCYGKGVCQVLFEFVIVQSLFILRVVYGRFYFFRKAFAWTRMHEWRVCVCLLCLQWRCKSDRIEESTSSFVILSFWITF